MSADEPLERTRKEPVERKRVVTRPSLPPGPVADLNNALHALHREADLPSMARIRDRIVELAEGAEVSDPTATPSADTVHTVLTAPTPPANVNHVIAVAAALLYPRSVPGVVPVVRGDPRVQEIRRLWAAAVDHVPPGIPITETPAQHLEVRQTMPPGAPDEEALPAYIPRAHDLVLHDLAAAALSATPRSGIAVLISDSTSGKTRALYEVLHHPVLPAAAPGRRKPPPRSLAEAGWRVWPPANPISARQFLDELAGVGPRTVVWLNEAQRYLITSDLDTARAIALGLRDLLADPRRTPVLVLGTLWPRYLDQITAAPASPQDPLDAARALLVDHTIAVPGTFKGADLDAARTSHDTRVQDALAAADAAADSRGQATEVSLTQNMAGVPALLDLYRTASTTVKAVLHAAMDARRLGHNEWLPVDLLQHAAPAYLTPPEQRQHLADPQWFSQALDVLTTPLHAAAARALHRPLAIPGHPTGDLVRLEDYLDQHGGTARRGDWVPAALWEGLIAHSATPDDLVWVGALAESRMLFGIAERCYRKAGTPRTLVALANLYDNTDRTAEAVALMRARASTDDPAALDWLRDYYQSTGDDESALAAGRRLVEIGGTDADRNLLARLLEYSGRPDDALTHWGILAAGGHREALSRVVKILIDSERFDDALAVLAGEPASADHQVSALTDEVLRRANRVIELEHRYREREDTHDLARLLADRGDVRGLLRLADNGDAAARYAVVRELVERGEREQAETHVRRWTTPDDPDALWSMPQLYEQVGLPDEALPLWLAADRQEPDNDDLQAVIADCFFSAGRIDELRERADNPKDGRARNALARWLVANGSIDELRDRAQSGDVPAACALADWLVADGHPVEAIAAWEDMASTDNHYGLERLASLHAAHGDPARAREIAAALAIDGGKQARQFYVDTLSATEDESTLRSLLGKPGYASAANKLGEKLAERGDYRGLIELVLLGVEYSRWYLTKLAKAHPSGDEWTTLWRRGLTPDGQLAPPPDRSPDPELDDQS